MSHPENASREELLRELATDPATGLSHREAERRRDRSDAKPLYATTAKSFPRCLSQVLREPVLWILLVVSLIALFFNRVPLGVVCFALTAGHTLLCAVLLFRAERVDATMQKAYDAPVPRVLRSGRVCRVGADAVVPGDILLLRSGDLIPADCRLLSTEHFAVTERELDATRVNRPEHCLEKDADALPDGQTSHKLSPPHMVYAGAVARKGSAVAVAVAIGDKTHLGGLQGSIRPSHGGRPSRTRTGVARWATFSSILLAVAVIPLVAIGIFTLRDRYELLDIFLSAVALASLGLCEHTVARYAALTSAIRRDAATLRDTDNTADLRSDMDAERLCSMTDLLLLGTAALHDGIPHPAALWTYRHGEETVSPCDEPTVSRDAAEAVELLFLWHRGRTSLPAADTRPSLENAVGSMLPALCEWAETDTEALLVRYRDIRVSNGGVSATVSSPEGDRRVTVRVTENIHALRDGQGTENAACRKRLREMTVEGSSSLTVSLSDADGDHVRALLAYAPRTSEKTAGWVKAMESAGIRVAALLPDTHAGNTRILAACGLTERYPAVRPTHTPRPLAAIMADGVRAFEGCSDREIADCIKDLQADGRTVGVLSVDARDAGHLHAADVAITVSPSLFRAAEEDFARPMEDNVTAPDGTPDAERGTDLLCRRADVVVRRTRVSGGGLGGVRTALLFAERMQTVTEAASGYLFLSSALRLWTVLLAAACGLLPIPAELMLFSGFVLDAVVLFSLGHIPPAAVPARRSPVTDHLVTDPPVEKPWKQRKYAIICLAATSLLPWPVALVARVLGAGIETGLAGYALLCLVAAEIALYITLRPRRDARGRERSDRTYALTLLLLMLFYVGSLAAALAGGLHPLYALLVPPIPALLYLLATAVVDKLLRRRE